MRPLPTPLLHPQIFCIEIMLNVLVYGVAYFRDLLLMFDAIVVFVSLVRGL